ncbi:hypothetical protein V5O48_019593, partial [Marasmius crinis-equi]
LFEDGLDGLMQDLFFTFATWVSYCNLRLHTDSTLATFETTTRELGQLLRKFVKETSHIKTQETPDEVEKRLRRNLDGNREASPKGFSLINYKTHALGHYIQWIRYLGTVDGFNTQAGEREHRRVKQFYGITNKDKFEGQIAHHVERQAKAVRGRRRRKGMLAEMKKEELPPEDDSVHY